MSYMDQNIYYYCYECDEGNYFLFFVNSSSPMKFETAFKTACHKNAVDYKNDPEIISNIDAIKKEMEIFGYKALDYEMGANEFGVDEAGEYFEGKECFAM